MKTHADIVEHLKKLIEDITVGEIPAASIQSDSRIIADLKLDSMDYATVMLTTERWLNTKIKEDDVNWSEIQTITHLADLFVLTVAK